MPEDENIQENDAIQADAEVSEPKDAQAVDASEDVNDTVENNSEPKAYDFTNADSEEKTVTVQPVKFSSFDNTTPVQGETNKNLDLLMDIKLQLTVELGRAELPIKKVLELTRGSIIELEKVAGEPVELYANGKLVAHGEVVVIEDNFGLRITSITEPDERLKGIKA
ncbi:flagellar motor switch protein FliN [bacterium]|nr:flagellar motor switch protein FliN [bacterium]